MTSLRYNVPDEFHWYSDPESLNQNDWRGADHIVRLFGSALDQNDIWLKRDMEWEFATYYRAKQNTEGKWEPVKSLCVTLTFKDSALAMLFKLTFGGR